MKTGKEQAAYNLKVYNLVKQHGIYKTSVILHVSVNVVRQVLATLASASYGHINLECGRR